MSITLTYRNVADEITGERTLPPGEPLIDGVLRATSLSATAAFSPPMRFVASLFIGNYRDEFQRGSHCAQHIVYLAATPRAEGRTPNKFQADLWCEFIYSERGKIASTLSGVPASVLPGKLKIGEIRFDWLPEEARVEILFAIAPDQVVESFEAACRSVDQILAEKWDFTQSLSTAVRSPSGVSAKHTDLLAQHTVHERTILDSAPSEQQIRELFKNKTHFQEETAEALTALFLDDFEGTPISPQRALLAILKETSSTVPFYSCFISYSTQDQEFAERLYADLKRRGVRCWFAPHDVRGGRKLHKQIEKAIHLNDRLLLILSEHSMSSTWVKSEIAHARQEERTGRRQVLFPVGLVPYERIRQWKLFDADVGDDSAREIREYFIPDFSNWKAQDSYQKAFERLVRDLVAVDQEKETENR